MSERIEQSIQDDRHNLGRRRAIDTKEESWLRRSSIASRVDLSSQSANTERQRRRLTSVVLALAFSFLVVFLLVAVVNEVLIRPHITEENTKKEFADDIQTTYRDIVKDTVPFVQDWYRGLKVEDEGLLPGYSKTADAESETDPSCLERWLDDIRFNLSPDGNPFTAPEGIERVLADMGLARHRSIREHLTDLLTEPQPLIPIFDSALNCTSSMEVPLRLACTAEFLCPDRLSVSTPQQTMYLVETLHRAVVLEKLTTELLKDPPALREVVDTMQTNQHERYEQYVNEKYGRLPVLHEFRMAKYEGVANTLNYIARALGEDELPTVVMPDAQLNLLEAVKVDALLGFEQNARVGLALASAVQIEPTMKNYELKWRLGEDWVDAYIAWNSAFIVGSVPYGVLSKLYIPSVSCTHKSDLGEDFLSFRAVSLALSLMQIQEPIFEGLNLISGHNMTLTEMDAFYSHTRNAGYEGRHNLAGAMGITNYRSLKLPVPSKDRVERMLFTLCGGTCHDNTWMMSDKHPISMLSNEGFNVYVAFVIWITSVLAGVGLELLVLLNFLHQGWNNDLERFWRFAQFLFPLFMMTTLGLAVHHNFMALMLIVPGLWKFGFPEATMYMYATLYKDQQRAAKRFAHFLNAVGTVIHHGAASLVISTLLSGAGSPGREVLNPILVLVMQHWFVLLKYVNRYLYMILELGLEVWFEYAMFSEMEAFFRNHWTLALAGNVMLVAHWMYILAAGVGLAVADRSAGTANADIDIRSSYLKFFRVKRRFDNSETAPSSVPELDSSSSPLELDVVHESSCDKECPWRAS